MSERLPSLKADEVIRALRKAGFEVTRIKESHHIVRHRDDPSRSTVCGACSCRQGHQARPIAQDHWRCRAHGRRVQSAAVTWRLLEKRVGEGLLPRVACKSLPPGQRFAHVSGGSGFGLLRTCVDNRATRVTPSSHCVDAQHSCCKEAGSRVLQHVRCNICLLKVRAAHVAASHPRPLLFSFARRVMSDRDIP